MKISAIVTPCPHKKIYTLGQKNAFIKHLKIYSHFAVSEIYFSSDSYPAENRPTGVSRRDRRLV